MPDLPGQTLMAFHDPGPEPLAEAAAERRDLVLGLLSAGGLTSDEVRRRLRWDDHTTHETLLDMRFRGLVVLEAARERNRLVKRYRRSDARERP